MGAAADFLGRAAQVLINASQDSLFVVSYDHDDPKTAVLYTESPEELALKDGEPQYYLVRVFCTRQEADRFRDAQMVSYPGLTFSVVEFKSFEELAPALQDCNRLYKKMLGIPARAVLARMPSESWPKDEFLLFDPEQQLN